MPKGHKLPPYHFPLPLSYSWTAAQENTLPRTTIPVLLWLSGGWRAQCNRALSRNIQLQQEQVITWRSRDSPYSDWHVKYKANFLLGWVNLRGGVMNKCVFCVLSHESRMFMLNSLSSLAYFPFTLILFTYLEHSRDLVQDFLLFLLSWFFSNCLLPVLHWPPFVLLVKSHYHPCRTIFFTTAAIYKNLPVFLCLINFQSIGNVSAFGLSLTPLNSSSIPIYAPIYVCTHTQTHTNPSNLII